MMKKTAQISTQNAKRPLRSEASKTQNEIKKYVLRITYCVLLFVILSLMSARSAYAQVLSLSPQTATKGIGEEFDVLLNIDTEGKAVAGTDVKLTFDTTALEVIKITDGDFFSENGNNLGTGTLYIMGGFKEQFGTKTGSGKVATLTLKGKKSGTAQLTFVCTTQNNDTNISDASGSDIINCTGTKNGSYTFATSSGATSTPTPTGSGSPTATATPPVSGISLPTIFLLGAGALLLILGIAGVIII